MVEVERKREREKERERKKEKKYRNNDSFSFFLAENTFISKLAVFGVGLKGLDASSLQKMRRWRKKPVAQIPFKNYRQVSTAELTK